MNIRRAYEVADEYKKRGITVVIGGIHVSMVPEEASHHADTVVIGEGEKAWPQVVQDFENGQLKKIYRFPACTDLGAIPMPRFDLIKKESYLKLPFRKSPLIPVYTSRGCPHNCSFCSVSKFWGKNIRFKPVAAVVEEIKMSGGDSFFFTDDNFLASPSKTAELCKALKPLKIKFLCQIDSLVARNLSAIEMLKDAGCFIALVGFERIDFHNFKKLNKEFNLQSDYKALIDELHRNSIAVYASLILGLEGDTLEYAKSLLEFLNENKVELAALFPLTPLPGTELFKEMKTKHQIKDESWWLNQVEPGKEGLLNYDEKTENEYVLTRFAMKEFYSLKSIIARYARIKPFKLVPLAMNLHTRNKIKKTKFGCVI
jgi:radical SAM superfamily enzyme YgiQ (UPF0313 family)